MENQEQNNKLTREEFIKRIEEGQRLFQDIDLSGVDLSGIKINKPANIVEGEVNIQLKRVNFSGANFTLESVNLIQADLSEANLAQATLSQIKFNNKTKFTKANVQGIVIQDDSITLENIEKLQEQKYQSKPKRKPKKNRKSSSKPQKNHNEVFKDFNYSSYHEQNWLVRKIKDFFF